MCGGTGVGYLPVSCCSTTIPHQLPFYLPDTAYVSTYRSRCFRCLRSPEKRLHLPTHHLFVSTYHDFYHLYLPRRLLKGCCCPFAVTPTPSSYAPVTMPLPARARRLAYRLPILPVLGWYWLCTFPLLCTTLPACLLVWLPFPPFGFTFTLPAPPPHVTCTPSYAFSSDFTFFVRSLFVPSYCTTYHRFPFCHCYATTVGPALHVPFTTA